MSVSFSAILHPEISHVPQPDGRDGHLRFTTSAADCVIAPLPHFDTAGRHANERTPLRLQLVRPVLPLALILPRCDEDLIAASSRDAV